jgi:hypothetical protein
MGRMGLKEGDEIDVWVYWGDVVKTVVGQLRKKEAVAEEEESVKHRINKARYQARCSSVWIGDLSEWAVLG